MKSILIFKKTNISRLHDEIFIENCLFITKYFNQALICKETIAVFISNAISDYEMSYEIKHTKYNFRLKLGNS